MNQVIVVFAILAVGVSWGQPHLGNGAVFEQYAHERAEPRSDINKDITDIIDLVKKSQVENVIKQCIATDAEVAKDWAFATSDGVKKQGLAIENSPEFQKVMSQLAGAKVNTKQFINMFHDILNWQHVFQITPMQNSGLRGCLAKVKPAVPMTKIKLLAAKKYLLSSAFRKLVKVITGKEFKANVIAIFKTSNVVNLIKDAQNNGVDMQAIVDFLKDISPIYNSLMLQQKLY